jgi:hypothetical protein
MLAAKNFQSGMQTVRQLEYSLFDMHLHFDFVPGRDKTPQQLLDEIRARVAVAILNDPDVRAALAGRGVAIPDDTWFVAGLHDTTTDELSLFDRGAVPTTHAAVRWPLRMS